MVNTIVQQKTVSGARPILRHLEIDKDFVQANGKYLYQFLNM